LLAAQDMKWFRPAVLFPSRLTLPKVLPAVPGPPTPKSKLPVVTRYHPLFEPAFKNPNGKLLAAKNKTVNKKKFHKDSITSTNGNANNSATDPLTKTSVTTSITASNSSIQADSNNP
jgi:hypothetical protein